jgi:hypothetical protein
LRVDYLFFSVPRIVRTGDEFRAGVAITIHDKDFSSSVTVDLSEIGEQLVPISATNLTKELHGDGVYKFDFRFRARGTGSAKLIFKATVRAFF